MYFAPLLKGFPLEWGTSTVGQKTRMVGYQGRERSLTISSAMWIQYTNVKNRLTNRQMDTGWQQRPCLPIASHGKNGNNKSLFNSASNNIYQTDLTPLHFRKNWNDECKCTDYHHHGHWHNSSMHQNEIRLLNQENKISQSSDICSASILIAAVILDRSQNFAVWQISI